MLVQQRPALTFCVRRTQSAAVLRALLARGWNSAEQRALDFTKLLPEIRVLLCNCLFRPRPHKVSLVGLSNIRVSGVSVLEVRIVFGR
jgi:hypothetical protein